VLHELHIENVAVIERADLTLHTGLNVLTGETGAGKSIIIDALGAVLGSRTSRELVRTGADKAVVSAVFSGDAAENWCRENGIDTEEETIVIHRRITAAGKSVCRINGLPVSVTQLRALGALLMDIHGQNDGRQLLDEERHRIYLDQFGDYEQELTAFQTAYAAYRDTLREMEQLTMDEIEKARLSDSLSYQIAELEQAALEPGEYETLSDRRDLLKHAEKLTEAVDSAYAVLYGDADSAVSMVGEAENWLIRASGYSEALQKTANVVSEARFLLEDATEQLRDFRADLDFSPEEYDQLESRLSTLKRLFKKYHGDEASLLGQLDDCRKRLDDLEYADERLEKLQKKCSRLQKQAEQAAKALTAARERAGKILQERIEQELHDLSMPSARFLVSIAPLGGDPGFDRTGGDRIRFLLAANRGEAPGSISRIASGGELSRIMLAMKQVFAERDGVDALVFDEIDTGVSGVAAQRVGEKLATLSRHKQVLCITHLPQIAAMADAHYEICKTEHDGRTFTDIKELERSGRRYELARLHGGDHITDTTLHSAEEQLRSAEQFKASVGSGKTEKRQ
jgi:DNA repair protein RecN (Recombination protein N)